MIYLLLSSVLIFGCTPKGEQSIKNITYERCIFGRCTEITADKKVILVEKLDGKCRYYVPDLEDSFWGDCK